MSQDVAGAVHHIISSFRRSIVNYVLHKDTLIIHLMSFLYKGGIHLIYLKSQEFCRDKLNESCPLPCKYLLSFPFILL